MMKLFIEIRTKSYQQLREELGIPEDGVWVQDLEHGLEITVEPQSFVRTANCEAIVSLTLAIIGRMPALVAGTKWLYERIKKSQVAGEIEVVRRETVPFTEAILLELLKDAEEGNQTHIISVPASPSPTVPEQIQQLVVLHQTGALADEEFIQLVVPHQTGALTDEEFIAKKAELLACNVAR